MRALQIFWPSLSLPVGSATLTRTRGNAGQQPTRTELLLNVGIKFTIRLTLLKLPQDMATLLSFFNWSFSLLLAITKNIIIK